MFGTQTKKYFCKKFGLDYKSLKKCGNGAFGVIYTDNKATKALKITKKQNYISSGREKLAIKEKFIRFMGDTGGFIPELYLSDNDNVIEILPSRNDLIFSYCVGYAPSKPYIELTRDEKLDYAQKLGSLIGKLHAKSKKAFDINNLREEMKLLNISGGFEEDLANITDDKINKQYSNIYIAK